MKQTKSNEVNVALKHLNQEIETVTGLANIKTIYTYIKQQNKKIKELEDNMCIYARENIGDIDFDSDEEVIKYFANVAENVGA